jgi:hypothetical protein
MVGLVASRRAWMARARHYFLRELLKNSINDATRQFEIPITIFVIDIYQRLKFEWTCHSPGFAAGVNLVCPVTLPSVAFFRKLDSFLISFEELQTRTQKIGRLQDLASQKKMLTSSSSLAFAFVDPPIVTRFLLSRDQERCSSH